jgi:HlyD family secretion protein
MTDIETMTLPVSRMRALRLLASALALAAVGACSHGGSESFQGYVEGEYLYLAAPQSGYLKSLDVLRGNRVSPGQTVFEVGADPDDQALAEAEARARSAQARVENMKEPRRAEEVAALESNLRAAQAGLRLAQIQLDQQESLVRENFVSQEKVDEARSNRDQALAQVDAAQHQIASYRTTFGRQPEVRGARDDLKAAAAQAAQKRWVVERKRVAAPAAGEIVDTYYRPGEWVPSGSPVASLLPDSRRRLRFFVAEAAVAAIRPGDVVEATCDGCGGPIRATVDFVAPRAEYTPPVIYSRETRSKLVFRVEAVPPPELALRLRPGLPVDVRRVATVAGGAATGSAERSGS